MAVYYLIYGALALPALFASIGQSGYRIILAVSFLPVAYFTWAKGAVGTDTAAYLAIINQVILGSELSGVVEPGFELLLHGFSRFSNDPFVILNAVALASIFISLLALMRLPWQVSLIVSAVYVPYFLVDGAFNVIRLGLALSLCLLSYAEYRKSRYSIAAIPAIVAISIQFTVVLPVVLVVILTAKPRWTNLTIVVLGVASVVWVFFERANSKYEVFAESGAGKGWSGLAVLVIAILLVAFEAVSSRGIVRTTSIVLVALIGLCSVPNEYGHLTIRIGQLLLFALTLLIAHSFANRSAGNEACADFSEVQRRHIGPISWAIILGIFLAAAIFRLRNFAGVPPTHPTPYVPYRWRQ